MSMVNVVSCMEVLLAVDSVMYESLF